MTQKRSGSVSGAAFMIAGTCIGAGMLALPSLTGLAGFLPAILSNLIVWSYMLLTGWFLAEACLWSGKPFVHVSSLAVDHFGQKGKYAVCLLFIFLYECLLISYFSGGAPYFQLLISNMFGLTDKAGKPVSFFVLGLITTGIIYPGAWFLGRLNSVLMAGLFMTFIFLVTMAVPEVSSEHLLRCNWPGFSLPFPILMGAFGYHNIIPTLVTYLGKDAARIRRALCFGTLIPLVIYLIWQGVVIGILPGALLEGSALKEKVPVIETIIRISNSALLTSCAYAFTFFAIITSLLGVAFSMADFLSDFAQKPDHGPLRLSFCLLTVAPPLCIAYVHPNLFIPVFNLAAGFGEAALNGLFPIALFYKGLWQLRYSPTRPLPGGKLTLGILIAFTLVIIALTLSRLNPWG